MATKATKPKLSVANGNGKPATVPKRTFTLPDWAKKEGDVVSVNSNGQQIQAVLTGYVFEIGRLAAYTAYSSHFGATITMAATPPENEVQAALRMADALRRRANEVLAKAGVTEEA